MEIQEGRGLEMWRWIHSEWVSQSAHVMETYRAGFLHPTRCKNMEDVRLRLPKWQMFGREYEEWYGHNLTDESKIQALKLLVPPELTEKIESYTFMENRKFEDCIRWLTNLVNDRHARSMGAKFASGAASGTSSGPSPMELGAMAQTSEQLGAAQGIDQEGIGAPGNASAYDDVLADWAGLVESPSFQATLMQEGQKDPQMLAAFATLQGKVSNLRRPKQGTRPFESRRPTNQRTPFMTNQRTPFTAQPSDGSFPGSCHYCLATGHKASQCKKREADQKAGIFRKTMGPKATRKSAAAAEECGSEESAGNPTWLLGCCTTCPKPIPVPTNLQHSGMFDALREDKEEEKEEKGETWRHACERCEDEQEMVTLLLQEFPEAVVRYAEQEGIPTYQAAEEMVEGAVLAGVHKKWQIQGKTDGTTRVGGNGERPVAGSADKNGDLGMGQLGMGDNAQWWTIASTRRAKKKRVWSPLTAHPLFNEVGCLVRASEPQTIATATEVVSSRKVAYRKISALVDSGAAAHVLPATVLEDYPVVAGSAKNGVRYMTADGNELPDLGTKQIPFRTREGHDCGVNWQIADIQRPLLSVTTLTAAGNQIHFNKDGGTITTKDGKKTMQFYCRNGVYVLDLWVPPF